MQAEHVSRWICALPQKKHVPGAEGSARVAEHNIAALRAVKLKNCVSRPEAFWYRQQKMGDTISKLTPTPG
jgi:hypothetical protein